MGEIIEKFIKEIFKREYRNLVYWCKQHKLFIVFIIIIILSLYYYQYTITFLNYIKIILGIIPQWIFNIVFIISLVFIFSWIHKDKKHLLIAKGDFFDNFQKGLRSSEWEYYEDWRIEEDDNKNVLSVTNSCDGGLVRIGTQWINYIFSFETKIIRNNSSWIVKAKDRYNYIMFQCHTDEIIPHIRINKYWEHCEPIKLVNVIKTNTWYDVSLKIKGDVIEIEINNNSVRYTVPNIMTPNDPKLYTNESKRVSFDIDLTSGRVGFRECGNEKAFFRKVKITTIK